MIRRRSTSRVTSARRRVGGWIGAHLLWAASRLALKTHLEIHRLSAQRGTMLEHQGEAIVNIAIRVTTTARAAVDRVELLREARVTEAELRRRARRGTLNARERALVRRLNALEFVESGKIAESN